MGMKEGTKTLPKIIATSVVSDNHYRLKHGHQKYNKCFGGLAL